MRKDKIVVTFDNISLGKNQTAENTMIFKNYSKLIDYLLINFSVQTKQKSENIERRKVIMNAIMTGFR